MAEQEKFTPAEKLEVLAHFIEQWRPARDGLPGERATYLTLKAIARDIKAADPHRASTAAEEIQAAIDRANRRKRRGQGYEPGNLREIAELVIGRWMTIRKALERFGEQEQAS